MLPLIPLTLAGSALAAGAAVISRRTAPARDAGASVQALLQKQTYNWQAVFATVQRDLRDLRADVALSITNFDTRYQHFVQTHINPLLMDPTRTEQLALSAAGRQQTMSPQEQEINRHIGIGIGAVAAVGVAHLTALPLAPLVIATGFYLTIPLLRICWQIAVQEHRLSVAHLLALYFMGMWLGGYYTVGAVGMILLGVAQKMMVICENNMRDNLVSIFGQQPQRVWVVIAGVETEIHFAQLRVDDILVLDVGQMAPIDGVVVQGMASIDQRMLTGEAQPVEKGVGDSVLAASVVLGGRIRVRVEKTGSATTAAKIGEVLNRNEQYRLATEQKAIAIAEKSLLPMLAAGALALPLAGISGMFAILGSNFTMNMVALRPLTVLNFFNTASRQGILIKDAEALEQLKQITTIVFEKTGTLTLEQPHVVQIHVYNGMSREEVLCLAAAAEHRQTHPIAQAILAAAADQHLDVPAVEAAAYMVGYGIAVQVAGQRVRVGSLRFMQSEEIHIPAAIDVLQATSQANGHSLVFVATGEALAGAIELQATIRPEAKQVVQRLKQQGLALYIISGDYEAPTRQLAEELGIPHYFAGVLPEQKADLVAKLQRQGNKVCFVGDGINDAIALRQADVSVSLRGATTAATDTAQIVLMNADLGQLHTLFHLAHELDRNLAFNFKVATAFSLLSGGSILFLHLKFVAVEVLAASQLLTGVGIASQPLLVEAAIPTPALLVEQ